MKGRGDKFIDIEKVASLIREGDTVGLIGGGGGLVEASLLHEAVEKQFLETGSPAGLTILHALGIGDRDHRGVNRFAHPGMVRRVIGGHWVWSPRMQQMARDNEIEAYVLPGGVAMQLMREIAAKRPGLMTHVGLGTFVDPRHGGGKMNEAAHEDIVELIKIDDQEYLRYLPFPVNVALLKGSVADDDGNISLDEEPANVDIYAMAAAAHNSGGKVIFQVRRRVASGLMGARTVRIPSAIVDAIVVDPDQRQGYELVYDPAVSGESFSVESAPDMPPFSIRQIIARRAEKELYDGAVINYGFGIPDEVASIVAAKGELDRYYQTIEHGTYGGTFLGFGEIDRAGNVNVSRLGGLPVGPGGFIDIAQNARKVVFCGTFDAKGARHDSGEGTLEIKRQGEVRKLVERVEQITFSGEQSLCHQQEVLYITERAVFRLTVDGLALTEVAPGIDVQKDILDVMDFAPVIVNEPLLMDAAHFTDLS